MRYIDYFKDKISSIPVSVTSKTVESILVRLFSAFTELVEGQIQFLHQSNKLHLISNAIPLLQYIRGSHIPIDFYQPTQYKCLVKFTSTNPNAQWQGALLNNINFVYKGKSSSVSIINTVLIPASNTNVSQEVEVTFYGLNDTSIENLVFNGADFLQIKLDGLWSDSIEIYVGNIKWRKIKHLREATDNCYLVTLNEYRRPVVIFPKNTPVGAGRVQYRLIDTNIENEINIIGGLQTDFLANVQILEITNYTTLPTINNLKNSVRKYYEKTEWTPKEVEDLVSSIIGILKAKYIRLETSLVLIEITTEDNTLIGYLGLIEDALKGYKEYTQDEVIVRLSTVNRFNIGITIYGVENYDVNQAVTSYIKNNTTLKLGDMYEVIESSITGNSQITEAYFSPLLHVEEMPNLVLQINNFNTILSVLYLQVIAVTSSAVYLYQVIDDEAKFISKVNINQPAQYITLLDGSLINVAFIGEVVIGKYNFYQLVPSLTVVGELSPDYNFDLGEFNITYK